MSEELQASIDRVNEATHQAVVRVQNDVNELKRQLAEQTTVDIPFVIAQLDEIAGKLNAIDPLPEHQGPGEEPAPEPSEPGEPDQPEE